MASVSAGHSQGVRAFFSLDLFGSTAFKNANQAEGPESPVWITTFKNFYARAFSDFKAQVEELFAQQRESQYFADILPPKVYIWKVLGDEIIFYTTQIVSPEQLAVLVSAFNLTVEKLD